MSGRVGAILLAAGQGRRLGHDKSVTSIAGQPVLSYGLRALLACGEIEKVVVTVRADEAAALAGSLGMLPSASLGSGVAGGGTFGFYEPAGGTAPDIAGKNVANPIAQILSAALMLRHSFGQNTAGQAIQNAVLDVLAQGLRTGDIHNPDDKTCKRVGTREMGEAISLATAKNIANLSS